MANKNDIAAAKQRKQKIVLVVGFVLLAGLLAFQLPKLLKSGSSGSSASASPASPAPSASSSGSDTAAPGTAVPAVAAGPGSARLAGVVINPARPPVARKGQLWSLSRFAPKDPFVQQVEVKAGASSGGGSTSGGSTSGGSAPSRGGALAPAAPSGAPGGAVTPKASAAPLAYATILVNGRPQQLALKQLFPQRDQTFVLVGIAKRAVKIAVAGGAFTSGKAITIELGKRITLMNTATGQRFVMKLVYTGSQPELIEGFKAPQPAKPVRLVASAP